MALSVSFTGDKGQTTTYHRIQAAAGVYAAGQESIQVNLAGYASADFRNEEKTTGKDKILSTTPIVLPFKKNDDGSVIEDLSRTALYSRIKAEVDEFSGATDN